MFQLRLAVARTKPMSVAVPSEIAIAIGHGVDGVDANESLGNLLRVAIETIQIAKGPRVSLPLSGWKLVPNAASDQVAMCILARAAKRAGPGASDAKC